MLVCSTCGKEMKCIQNSVGCYFGNGHVYIGDEFKCPSCGFLAVVTNKHASHDPSLKLCEKYINMRK